MKLNNILILALLVSWRLLAYAQMDLQFLQEICKNDTCYQLYKTTGYDSTRWEEEVEFIEFLFDDIASQNRCAANFDADKNIVFICFREYFSIPATIELNDNAVRQAVVCRYVQRNTPPMEIYFYSEVQQGDTCYHLYQVKHFDPDEPKLEELFGEYFHNVVLTQMTDADEILSTGIDTMLNEYDTHCKQTVSYCLSDDYPLENNIDLDNNTVKASILS